jgi:membrane protein YdbS with pleckstrin-like domain
MSSEPHVSVAWAYRGVWGVLSGLFKVPRHPPTLPYHDAAAVESFRPADAFLRYLKFKFWALVLFIGAVLSLAVGIAAIAKPIVGLVLAPPVGLVCLVVFTAGYIAIHLRFDTTWYVLTDRSLRIRRGIWVIHETTITFENVQNVVVNQGPLQRIYGVADVVVQTAGGGSSKHGEHGEDMTGPHAGLLQGLADAPRVRDVIMARLQQTRSSGLGDEAHADRPNAGPGWTPEHLDVLREIRDLARAARA